MRSRIYIGVPAVDNFKIHLETEVVNKSSTRRGEVTPVTVTFYAHPEPAGHTTLMHDTTEGDRHLMLSVTEGDGHHYEIPPSA